MIEWWQDDCHLFCFLNALKIKPKLLIFIVRNDVDFMPKKNTEELSSKSLIRLVDVLQIEDNLDTASQMDINRNSFGRRIKVRLFEDDPKMDVDDLPWVWPLLPKHLHIMPKVGEKVMVFLQTLDAAYGNRYYLGPIISQDYYLDNGGSFEALSLLQGVSTKPLCHPKGNSNNDGTYPDSDTLAIQGRGDSAMWLKDEELRLMCGHKPHWRNRSTIERADPGSLEFNKNSLGYIQMKYMKFKKNEEFGQSIINVVADKINLISHSGANKDSKVNVTDQMELMPTESIEHFIKNGERMVYGDELIKFLNRFREVFAEHTHHWSLDKQVISEKDSDFWNKDLDKILCNSIRLL